MELPQPPPKIYIAANGPRMIELAGEVADGMVGWFQSLEYVRDVTMPALRRGAERAGARSTASTRRSASRRS